MQITIKHSLVDPETIKHILTNYDLSGDIHCEYLAKGLNDTYFVMDEKKEMYIFRLYRAGWRDYSAISFELQALLHLHEQSFDVSYPIQKKNGLLINELEAPEGKRYGVLFSYTEGERPEINAANSEVIGGTLGRLHRLSSDLSPEHERGFELDTNHLLDEPEAVISPVIEKYMDADALRIFKTVVENTKADLAELDLEKGFCHGDFHNHNMHIHDDTISVFDFDSCAVGYRGYDIAVSWWNLKNNYRSLEEECWDAFLQGYLAERNLSGAEMKSLPLFITARRIWLMGTMLNNNDVWGTNWINKRSLMLFIGQLRTDRLGDEDLRELDNAGKGSGEV